MTSWLKTRFDRWQEKAKGLKQETYTLYLAYRHPQTPWYAKLLAGIVAAYAFSPIDLIPDFIPVLGYLDDLILVPVGIAIVLKMVPAQIMRECREKARTELGSQKPVNRLAAVVIVLIWVSLAALAVVWIIRLLNKAS